MAKIAKADLILHPIRIRILMALSGERKTSQQLANDLRDIPQATLYRHITRLAQAGVIQVVAERRVRGATEKRYAIDETMTSLTTADMAGLSKDDHLRIFTAFIASLLDDFSRYLDSSPTFDPVGDGLAFRKFPLELSDEELALLSERASTEFASFASNQSGGGRRRRIFSFVVMPDAGNLNKSTIKE